VRRDTISLLSIQHTITQKEEELAKFHAATTPKILAQQKQKVFNMPVTDLIVHSTSQVNSRIEQEVEEQLQAAKRLAEAEFLLAAAGGDSPSGAGDGPQSPTPGGEDGSSVKKEVKPSKRKANAMTAAIAVTKDMVAEGNVPALSFVNPDEGIVNPKGPKRKKSA
jgi:hypothetical protein